MQYQVPQFIETEDTIIGSITLRQFIYLAVGAGIIMVAYLFFNFFFWLIFSVTVGAITLAFAFFKYNGRPLEKVIVAMLSYLWRPRVYVWQRKEELEAARAEAAKKRGAPLQNIWLRITAGKELITKRERFLPKNPEEEFDILEKTTGDKEEARRVDYR